MKKDDLTWIEESFRELLVHDTAGKILGGVRGSLAGRRWDAWLDVRPLGSYITKDAAVTAVEDALRYRVGA